MSRTTRLVPVIAGVLTAIALAGGAALAAPQTGPDSPMGDQLPAHMGTMEADMMAQMQAMMDSDATVGEMRQWMAEQDLPIGQMHRHMATSGMNPGQMHRSMTAPNR